MNRLTNPNNLIYQPAVSGELSDFDFRPDSDGFLFKPGQKKSYLGWLKAIILIDFTGLDSYKKPIIGADFQTEPRSR